MEAPSDPDSLRSRLLDLLPCQADIDLLTELSHGWWLVRRHIVPALLRMTEYDPQTDLSIAEISNARPVVIARLLLCIAICIQQLPPDCDQAVFKSSRSLEDVEARIVSTVKALTYTDAVMSNVEVVECLILLGIYDVNEGNFHSSWLSFRRAISVSQLLGMHRRSVSSNAETSDLTQAKRHFMWFRIVEGERYQSLLLGVPSATGSAPFPFDDTAAWLTPEDHYSRELGIIAGFLVERNQGDVMHALSATHEIDEKLTTLAASMPQAWWNVPHNLEIGRNDESGTQFECVVCQIWHFEMQALTHLPFMLRAAKDLRFEYSRISCLQACRNLINTWDSMRRVHGATFMSRLFDFQAYTAAITLLLGLFGRVRQPSGATDTATRRDDLELARAVALELEKTKQTRHGHHEVINDVGAINFLLATLRDESGTERSAHLVVPHFGSVVVRLNEAVRPVEGERIVGAAPASHTADHFAPMDQRSNVRPAVDITPITNYDATTGSMPATGAGPVWDGQFDSGGIQFTSSQMPILDPLSVAQDMDWLLQDDSNRLFEGLLDNNTGRGWEF
ncbi:hypothetical protein LTS14_002724 [Recurvomyces mirabilis]|nr:hypothetical protein LTS14_002724 [Recurvomyces mirabilis]